MAEQQHHLKMAMATIEDLSRLYLLYNVVENVVKYSATTQEAFDHFEEEEKIRIQSIFEDGEINYENLTTLSYDLMLGFHRVVMGFEVLRDNCADPELDYLDFNKDIKEERRMLNLIDDQLQSGQSLTIEPDSELGKEIMEWAKEEEVDNV